MTPPRRLDGAAERMDAEDVDAALLDDSLRHLEQVNRLLGARRAVLRELHALWPAHGAAVLLDVGTGAADLPLAIAEHARRRGRSARIVGLDRHAATAALAARRAGDRISVARADALALPIADRSVDFALLSMTLHHLEAGEREAALAELGRVARRAVIVGELERCWPNYLGARLLAATLWRSNPITRHDGPVSVLRSFTPDELVRIARRAGLLEPRVARRPFYRLVLVARPPQRAAASATVA